VATGYAPWYQDPWDQWLRPVPPRGADHGRVFILYAVVAGLLIGLVTGGSPSRLGDLKIAWAPLIALGMAVQLLLFSSPIGDALGPAAPGVYVVSNAVVLVAVARNLAIPGMVLVLVGGCSNLVAIMANGGYMPVSHDALVAIGRAAREGYSNNVRSENVVLAPLTDLFAMPAWVPMANIFSVGDVLIGVGAAIVVIAAMHGHGPLRERPEASSPAPSNSAPITRPDPGGASPH
jgi:Family of unknown function (DUF5317)